MAEKDQGVAWLADTMKALGAIVGFLTSLGVIFVTIGYTITLSYVQKMNLYGLANFPRDFFFEADLQFLNDLGSFLGSRSWNFPLFILAMFGFLCLSFRCRKGRVSLYAFLAIAAFDAYLILTLNKYSANWGKFIVFVFSAPLFTALLAYLAANLNQILDRSDMDKINYALAGTTFTFLLIAIPFSYGRNIFDLDVHSVNALEFDDKVSKQLNIGLMQQNINNGTKDLYWVMGHTSGKEVFFVSTGSPKQTILLDRGSITFLGVVRNEVVATNTLRSILAPTTPSEASQGTVVEKTGKFSFLNDTTGKTKQ